MTVHAGRPKYPKVYLPLWSMQHVRHFLHGRPGTIVLLSAASKHIGAGV